MTTTIDCIYVRTYAALDEIVAELSVRFAFAFIVKNNIMHATRNANSTRRKDEYIYF
jgi:hypothetical protein